MAQSERPRSALSQIANPSWDLVNEGEYGPGGGTQGSFQAARIQWLEQQLIQIRRGRLQEHERRGGGEALSTPRWASELNDKLRQGRSRGAEGRDGGAVPPPPPPLTQAAHVQQAKVDGADEGRDDLCAVAVVLPKLPEEGSHQAPLRCGDWIAEVAPLMSAPAPAGGGQTLWQKLARPIKPGWPLTH